MSSSATLLVFTPYVYVYAGVYTPQCVVINKIDTAGASNARALAPKASPVTK